MILSMQIQVSVHDPVVCFPRFDGSGLKMDLRKAVAVQNLSTLHCPLNLRSFVLGLFGIENAHLPRIDTQLDGRAVRFFQFARLNRSLYLMVVGEGREETRLVDAYLQ